MAFKFEHQRVTENSQAGRHLTDQSEKYMYIKTQCIIITGIYMNYSFSNIVVSYNYKFY